MLLRYDTIYDLLLIKIQDYILNCFVVEDYFKYF